MRQARRGERGHALYVSPVQGSGRIDNPEKYRVLYVADSPQAAVAEAFGNHGVWTPELLAGRPDLPGSVRALARFRALDLVVLDLDDPQVLARRKLRPSRVATRDRAVTQRWALEVHAERKWTGVRWWSSYDADWGAYGIWDASTLEVATVEVLSPEHPALEAARTALARPWAR